MADLMIFREQPIRERGEMLNLTDMWRGAGEDPSKRPAQWLRSRQAGELQAFLNDVGISHIIEQERGAANSRGGGASWSHWQLAMAYAKYLSPEFHAWCNGVVRAHMRGKERGAEVDLALVSGPRMGDTEAGRERIQSLVLLVKAKTGASTAAVHGWIRRTARVPSPYGFSLAFWPTIREWMFKIAEGAFPMGTAKRLPAKRRAAHARQLRLVG